MASPSGYGCQFPNQSWSFGIHLNQDGWLFRTGHKPTLPAMTTIAMRPMGKLAKAAA